MSTESRSHLREYCDSVGCEVWKAIKMLEGSVELEENERASLRRFCAENCHAYKFNRWIHTVNKEIKDRRGGERYK